MPKDIFSMSSLVDLEKFECLYIPTLTECPPNDPFNDWTIVSGITSTYYYDLLDSNSYGLVFNDDDGDDFIFTDEWINEIININSDIIDSENYDIVLNDNGGNDFEILDN